MNLMLCMRGAPEQLAFLPEIAELGAGIELGSYGLVGIQSERDWETRFALHRAVRAQFHGILAIHGPFVGMEFGHIDHLIRDAVQRRMDMTFEVATKLKASRLVLHSGHTAELDLFKLQDVWLKRSIDFWQREISRWEGAGIEIVLENATEKSPDLLVQLVDRIENRFLRLCMDIGHKNVFSELSAVEWVRKMDRRLCHIHLHDNDGIADRHWSLGRGRIDFEPFFAALKQHAPKATLSLEIEEEMPVRMTDLRKLAMRFARR